MSITLTERDYDVIQGVLEGKRNKEIAASIGITDAGVKIHISRLFDKLDVSSRHELANWGRAHAEVQRVKAASDYEVLRVMAQTVKLTPERARHIVEILLGGKQT